MKKIWVFSIVGFILGFVILLYLNYLPSYCTNLPKCNEPASISVTECCPDVGNFKCVGLIQEGSCHLTTYMLNPFSYVLAFPLFLVGVFIGYLIKPKNEN